MSPVLLSWRNLALKVSPSGMHLLMKTGQFREPGVAQLQADCTHREEDAQL